MTTTSTRAVAAAPGALGAAFALLFLVGSLTSSANTPDYTAADQAWTHWAHDNQNKSRISAFALLLAAFVFLYFIAGIRSVLETAESQVRGSAHLVRVAFAGGIVALIGAISFLTTSLTVINNKGNGSIFGYAFFPAILSLVTWTVAASVTRYRAIE